MTSEALPCCCGAIDCPQWAACLPSFMSVRMSLVCSITEEWDGLPKTSSDWVASADARLVRVNSGASAFMTIQTGTFSWNASATIYSFSGDTFGNPCRPCRFSYRSLTRQAVPIVDRPMVQGGLPQLDGFSVFCTRCGTGAAPVLTGIKFGMQAPFQWTNTSYSPSGAQTGQTIQSSNAERFVTFVGTRSGCLRQNTFKEYAVEGFGSVNDSNGNCCLTPALPTWWHNTGEKSCSSQSKSFGVCADDGGTPVFVPIPLMQWTQRRCDQIFDTHSCFFPPPTQPIQCGTSVNFPPFNEDGVVTRRTIEEVRSELEITDFG